MKNGKTNLMRMEAGEIAKVLGAIDSVVAVASFGSLFMKKLCSEPGDADLVLFCSKIPRKSCLKKCLKPFIKEWANGFDPIEDRAAFISNNLTHIDIALINIKLIEKKLEDFEMKVPPDMQLVSFVYNAKPLYDPKDVIRKYRKRMTPFPSWLRKYYRNSIGTVYFFKESDWIKKEMEKGNKTLINFRLVKMKEELDQLLFAINRRYYYHPKWVEREYARLKLIPKGYVKKSDEFANTKGVSLSKRVEILYEMAKGLEKLIRRHAPELLK